MDTDSGYYKNYKMYAFYWGGEPYLEMDVFGSNNTRLDGEGKLSDIRPVASKIVSVAPFKGELNLGAYAFKDKNGQPTPGKAFDFTIVFNGVRISNTIRLP